MERVPLSTPAPIATLLFTYGSSKYGSTTWQKASKSLSRSGCGPWRPDRLCEMRSPNGSSGSPVYSKTWVMVTIPASRSSVGPWVIDTFSGSPTNVMVRVTVPAASSITGPATLFDGPAAKLVIDLPLSAVKTAQKVPLANKPPLARSRTTDVPWMVVVPVTPQISSGNGPSVKWSTSVAPAATPVTTSMQPATAVAASRRSLCRMFVPPTPQ